MLGTWGRRQKRYVLNHEIDSMDRVLQGIMASEHPEAMKMVLIKRIAERSDQPQPPQVVRSVLQDSANWILDGESEFVVEAGFLVYQSWGRANPNQLESFFNQRYLLMLLDQTWKNESRVPQVIAVSLDMLRPGSHLNGLLKVTQTKAINYVQGHSNLGCLYNFVQLMRQRPELVPRGDFGGTFCIQLLQAMGSLLPKGTLDFVKAVHELASFLRDLWTQQGAAALSSSLRAIFDILSQEKPEPSICLGAVVSYIPSEIIESTVASVMATPNIDDASMIRALEHLIDWLAWPMAGGVNVWVNAFFKHLALARKYTVLVAVTESRATLVAEKLPFPPVQLASYEILATMLLSFQHCAKPFHKVLKTIPTVWANLERQNSSEEFRKNLSDLLHTLMYIHAGYPELYSPIVTLIKAYEKPSAVAMRQKQNQHKWLLPGPGDPFRFGSTDTESRQTARVGLVNRGNTCYANCVTQALFMNDRLRQTYLTENLEGRVTHQLQEVFAKLSASQRPSFLPDAYLSLFTDTFGADNQHDCNEYLQCVLSHLEEEQKAALGKESKPPASSEGSSGDSNSDKPPRNTVVEKIFSGLLHRSTKCQKCAQESPGHEQFYNLNLHFCEGLSSPQKSLPGGREASQSQAMEVDTMSGGDELKAASPAVPAAPTHPLELEDMISNYFRPENLSHYECNHCGPQEAALIANIEEAPDTLIIGFNRFSFDSQCWRFTKILTPVNLPRTLCLPVARQSQRSDASDPQGEILDRLRAPREGGRSHREVYGLTCMMIHTGDSMNSGHYYTYARHAVRTQDPSLADGEFDFFVDKWIKFNDASVLATTYGEIQDNLRSFYHETPYVVFYTRVGSEVLQDSDVSLQSSLASIDPPMRLHLRELVSQDNAKYLEEVELAARYRKGKTDQAPPPSYSWNWKDFDSDQGPPGNCGGGQGFGGFDSGPRFVF